MENMMMMESRRSFTSAKKFCRTVAKQDATITGLMNYAKKAGFLFKTPIALSMAMLMRSNPKRTSLVF